MNDPHLPPEERLKKLYAQTEATAIFTLESKLKSGIHIKKFVKSGQAMTLKIDNDFSEKNFSGTYISSLKAIIIYNQIRTKYKAGDVLYTQGLSREDFNECIQVLTYALDMAEKVKGKLMNTFRNEYEQYLVYCKEQERLERARKIQEEQENIRRLEQQAASINQPQSYELLPSVPNLAGNNSNSLQNTFPQFANSSSSSTTTSTSKIPPTRPPNPISLSNTKDLTIPHDLTQKFRQLAASNNSKKH